jgi:hypothetical protein
VNCPYCGHECSPIYIDFHDDIRNIPPLECPDCRAVQIVPYADADGRTCMKSEHEKGWLFPDIYLGEPLNESRRTSADLIYTGDIVASARRGGYTPYEFFGWEVEGDTWLTRISFKRDRPLGFGRDYILQALRVEFHPRDHEYPHCVRTFNSEPWERLR